MEPNDKISREKADPSGTAAGKKLLREMFHVAADGIEQHQADLSVKCSVSRVHKAEAVEAY